MFQLHNANPFSCAKRNQNIHLKNTFYIMFLVLSTPLIIHQIINRNKLRIKNIFFLIKLFGPSLFNRKICFGWLQYVALHSISNICFVGYNILIEMQLFSKIIIRCKSASLTSAYCVHFRLY